MAAKSTLRGATLRGATLRGATRILAAKGNSLFPAVIPIKPAATGGGTVTQATTTGGSNYNTSGHTTNTITGVTFASDTDFIAVDVMWTHFSSPAAISGITIDGIAATAISGTDTGGLNAGTWIREQAWGLVDPSGAGVTLGSAVNVIVTFAATVTVSQNVAQGYKGVDQTTPTEGGANSGLVAAGGGTKTQAPSTTTAAGDYLFGGYINFGSSTADVATVDNQLAENWDSNNGTITNTADDAITGSGETLGWTDLTLYNWAAHVFVIKAAAGGGGPTIMDLTLASLGITAQSILNKYRTLPTAASLTFTAQGVQNRRRVLPTAATFSFTPQAIQNRRLVTLTTAGFTFIPQAVRNVLKVLPTAATLSFTPQAIQNRRLASLTTANLTFLPQAVRNVLRVLPTTASLGFTAQTIQNRYLVKLTSATFNFTAQAVEVITGGGRVIMDLTVASFAMVAESVRNVSRVALTSAQINLTAQAISVRLRSTLTAASLALTAQSVTNKLIVRPTAATMSFVAAAVQNKWTVKLTAAVFNMQPMAVEFINAVLVELASRVRRSYSNYRKLLRQRRF
jgi:hypothetical protein